MEMHNVRIVAWINDYTLACGMYNVVLVSI